MEKRNTIIEVVPNFSIVLLWSDNSQYMHKDKMHNNRPIKL